MDHPFGISPYWSAGSGLGSGRGLDVLGAELETLVVDRVFKRPYNTCLHTLNRSTK